MVVDVGATNTRVGIGTRGKILDKKVFRTPRSGGEDAVANAIIKTVEDYYSGFIERVKAIGIASIGPLDIRRGRVVNTPNLPIRNFELLEPLREYFSKPVYVLNDAVAGAYGEYYYGAGKGFSNVVYITMSTGLGGGVIVDNHLLIGKMGNAHEIGHIVVKYDSKVRCGCGGFGHWEAYASGSGIPRLARILADEYKGPVTDAYIETINGVIDAKRLFDYYRRGDLFAKRVVDEVINASIAGLSTVINVYDPEVVTIGGPVFLYNQDILYEPIVKGVSQHLVTVKPLIKPTPLGEDVVLYGALALAVNPPKHLLKLQGYVSE